jgi:hypothetical protein
MHMDASAEKQKYKKIIGVVFIIIGFTALLTPFTPGSWLIFTGLGILGFKMLWWDKIKSRLKRRQNISHPLRGGNSHQG